MSDLIGSVKAIDPGVVISALGDPLELPSFSKDDIQDGDFAVVVRDEPWGLIYFMRPRSGQAPETAFDGDVVMTHCFTDPDSDVIEPPDAELARVLGAWFEIERYDGREMDGLTIPFFVVNEKGYPEHEKV